MNANPARATTLRYVSQFSCIGPACEDHCCHSWSVAVAPARLTQIRRVLRKDRHLLKRLNGSIEIQGDAQTETGTFAHIGLTQGSVCPMLDADRLCSLQRRHGVSALPDICNRFPRRVVDMRERIELTGTMSCPELARLGLLSDDATDLVEVALEPRMMPPEARMDPTIPVPVAQFFDRLRRCVHRLLGHTAFPWSSRLYILLEILHQMDTLAIDSPEVSRLLAAVEDDEALSELHEDLQRALPELPVNLSPLLSIATELSSDRSAFEALCMPILKSYVSAPDETPNIITGPHALADYLRRRDVAIGAFGENIDRCLRNYGRSLWFSDWSRQWRSLGLYVRGFVARLALLRFLLISHSDTTAAPAGGVTGAAVLTRTAVKLIYTFSRRMDHSSQAAESVHRILDTQVPDLSTAMSLIAI